MIKLDVYKLVTNRIIEKLEKDVIPCESLGQMQML